MIDFNKRDGIDYTARDVDQLIADADAGVLHGPGGGLGGTRRALMLARAQRIERAAEIVNGAVRTGQTITTEEDKRVAGLLADARALEPSIAELFEAERREHAEPAVASARAGGLA